ncbi:TIGR04104 family putative zinc finger protein [Cytobacillus massiliigabonensis]|uniref:TIGR04104 family putative zinc finger protein n=1 Tax=Cytobacillus massiliigabonensis TaxID=1871011 RepID=UPI0015E10D0F
MTKCDSCHSPFSWSKIYKANLLYSPVQCDHCSSKHMITFPSRLIVTAFTVLPFILFCFFFSPFNSIFLTLIIGLFITFLGSLLAPYAVNYKKLQNTITNI